MFWMVRFGVGIGELCCSYVAPCMYTISDCNSTRQLQYALLHVQLRGHGGLVLSWRVWCWLLA